MIGESLSHFKVVSKLGEGGMGVVYRGVDLDLDRPVAIKILPPEAQHDEDSVGRFLREAKTASKLQHPAITTIYEFGVKEHTRYLVMEFIEGKTLRELLSGGPLGLKQALEICIQAVDALSLAGEKGIIHRDIKPENIMVTERGQAKILDFGLAKMMEKGAGPAATDTFKTAVGTVMGTIRYMSPEQALGAELDPRTDIYSIGAVLFEMVTGKPPFGGNTPQIVLAKILNQPPPAPSDARSDLPPGLEKVIMKCLEKDRNARYASALHLLVELKAQKQQLESTGGWGATVVGMPRAAGPAAPVTHEETITDLIPPAAPATRTPSGGAPAVSPSGRVLSGGSPRISPSGRVLSGGMSGSAPVYVPAMTPSGHVMVSGALSTAQVQAAPLSDRERAARHWGAYAVRMLRRLFTVIAGLYALSCIGLFLLPLLKQERAMQLTVVRFMQALTDPIVRTVSEFLSFDPFYKNFNFLLLGLAIVAYLIQQIASSRLQALEAAIERPLLTPAGMPLGAMAGAMNMQAAGAAVDASRMSLLRQYAAAKRVLGEAKREMAFLAVDVAGSTRMKVGEDKLTIEHAFSEYKKFLERVFREFRAYKIAWTPDGVMVAFTSVDDACGAGRKILKDLDWFNSEVHQLKNKFQVRAGANIGEVMIPDDKPLEEISDHTIDVAGHMQKYAEKDTLWISGDAYSRLLDTSGFNRLDKQVDNHEVYEYRRP